MPETPDDTENIDKILAELKDESVEEVTPPKKDIKNPYKDKKNDEYNDYEFSEDRDLSDTEW